MATDPKGRTEPGHEVHVFVCSHERPAEAARPSCGAKDSLAVMKRLKAAAKASGLVSVRVQKSGCLDFCENGISCVVYPEAVWYSIRDPDADLPRILEHLAGGAVAAGCSMRFDDA